MTKITETGIKIKFMKVERLTKDTRIGLTNYIKKDFFMLIPVYLFYTVILRKIHLRHNQEHLDLILHYQF